MCVAPVFTGEPDAMPAPTPSRDLVHPLFLGAVGVLVVNDHVLKGSGLAPGWLTGKLSDFAGLFFFPVLALAVLELATRGRIRARRAEVGALLAAATALGFALVKLSPGVNAWVSAVWGPMTLDATDLVALPSAFLGWLFLVRGRSSTRTASAVERGRGSRSAFPELSRTQRALRFGALALAGLASIATSPANRVRNYPYWRIETLGARTIGCAKVDAWVSKSGKEGFGVTLEWEPLAVPCSVELRSARFVADRVTSDAAALPPPATLTKLTRTYVPFEFDNEALWNEGVRDGRLELVLAAEGAGATRLELALRHVWTGPHTARRPPHQAPGTTQSAAPPPAEPPDGSAPPLEPAPILAPSASSGFAEPPP